MWYSCGDKRQRLLDRSTGLCFTTRTGIQDSRDNQSYTNHGAVVERVVDVVHDAVGHALRS